MKIHDKQKEVTAASFKRIAKDCRTVSRIQKKEFNNFFGATVLKTFAEILDAEAKRLRAMR